MTPIRSSTKFSRYFIIAAIGFALCFVSYNLGKRSFASYKKKLRESTYDAKYLADYKEFERLGGKIDHKYPVVGEHKGGAGTGSGQYFHQDLLVANFIHKASPIRHIDIGSRVDGFIAHVASFRKIEVMDIRQLKDTGHQNIAFFRADLMEPTDAMTNITDSISSLHAIEHFGLGRYGDTVDPQGHIKGFNNILKMLKVGGTLYISFPISNANSVHFNAHRFFHPLDVLNWANDKNSLQLVRFDYIDDKGRLNQNVDLYALDASKLQDSCGIYTFKKLS